MTVPLCPVCRTHHEPGPAVGCAPTVFADPFGIFANSNIPQHNDTTEARPMAARKAKPEQTNIAGTERKVHKDVKNAATALLEIRGERQELTRREVEAADKLKAAMHKHEITEYYDDEITAVIVPAGDEKVKVRKKRDEPDVGDDD